MSKRGRYFTFLEKSVSAALSAIEIYNKPDFKYREESFCILMVNSWELLLKSKILYDNNNTLNSLYIKDTSLKTKRGKPFKNPPYKMNRAKNKMTIDINQAMLKTDLPLRLQESLKLLVEIRDNSIHFINESKLFEKKVLEIGTASLRSYVTVVNDWFTYDLSRYNFYLMPISFYHSFEYESFSINREDTQHKNLLEHIARVEEFYPSDENEEFNISLKLETKFVKSNSISEAISYKYDPDNPEAISVTHDVEDVFLKKYPWTHNDDLVPKLKSRYSDFKLDSKFNRIKVIIHKNIELSDLKYLDMINKKGYSRRFYSTNCIKEFDNYYMKRKSQNGKQRRSERNTII